MNKPAYTPGPWFADGIFIETEGGIAGRHIATVASKTKESQANAVLLAAAPELLATLKRLAYGDHTSDDVNAAISAIAKAEGRS